MVTRPGPSPIVPSSYLALSSSPALAYIIPSRCLPAFTSRRHLDWLLQYTTQTLAHNITQLSFNTKYSALTFSSYSCLLTLHRCLLGCDILSAIYLFICEFFNIIVSYTYILQIDLMINSMRQFGVVQVVDVIHWVRGNKLTSVYHILNKYVVE